MKRLRLHIEAEVELEQIFFEYAGKSPNIATQFYAEVVDGFSKVVRHSGIGAPLDNEYRKLVLPNFPYNIVYRESENLIYIDAIAHQRRNLGYWSDRN